MSKIHTFKLECGNTNTKPDPNFINDIKRKDNKIQRYQGYSLG